MGAPPGFEPNLERPRDRSHGDWASNAALVLARSLGQPPRVIAQQVSDLLQLSSAEIEGVEVAGPGFLNFRLSGESIWPRLAKVLVADTEWGKHPATGLKVNVEFVSANPTGPLHVAHGRGAALGDAVASLLEWAGNEVTREFYVNDAGRQIELLAESVDARWRELGGRPAEVPEGGYHGSYVQEVARRAETIIGIDALRAMGEAERKERLGAEAVRLLKDDQMADLAAFGVEMDLFYSERSLYDSGEIDRLLQELATRSLTYERDGATWLRTSAFGDEKDRVLIKSDGSYTYFLPDLAYHLHKARRGFDKAIDVWGADHQGHEDRMLAALDGLGHSTLLEVVIIQLVTVMRGGVEARMSKRAGRFITLRELVEETGSDVARYFFLMRRAEVHLNFDLDLALDTSDSNPVYKVQYAHARMCSVFRKARRESEESEATPEQLQPNAEGLERLQTTAEREVALAVLRFPDVVSTAAEKRAPHMMCAYLEQLAGLVNSWYHDGNLDPTLRILAPGGSLEGRLKLARAVTITLRNGLSTLGLSAPERM